MKKFWRSTTMTAIMFLLALGLLSVGAIGGTQAALNIRSNNYYSAFNMDHIGVALLDNGAVVAERTFNDSVSADPEDQTAVYIFPDPKDAKYGRLTPNLNGDKEVKIGKQYDMPITVMNTATIDQYVRVTLRKYWVAGLTDADLESGGYFHDGGTKIINDIYRPQYIQLGYEDGNGNYYNYNSSNWIRDEAASTPEREVYYYKGILPHDEQNVINESAQLINKISISPDVTQNAVATVSTEGGVTTTVYTYAYDGYGFVVIAEVDAVQTHHARAAMTSAWGTSSAVMTAMGVPSEA